MDALSKYTIWLFLEVRWSISYGGGGGGGGAQQRVLEGWTEYRRSAKIEAPFLLGAELIVFNEEI